MEETNFGALTVGTLRIEKGVEDGKLLFTFNEVTKDAKGTVTKKIIVGKWSAPILDMPDAVRVKAMEHGFLQKYGDALAGKKEYTVDECCQILEDMSAGQHAGDWNKAGRTKKEKGAEKVTETAALATLAELRNGPQGAMFASMSDEAAIALMRQFGMLK